MWMRVLAVCAGWLLAAVLIAAAQSSAPVEELGRDWFSATLEVGYGGYAFPIAEPALARACLSGTGLAWQTAFDHSVIPVRVSILHRRGAAFRGRVEVEAPYAYPLEEDAAGRSATYSAEFTAPPSVPTDVVLAPRICAPSEPGALVKLEVRLYQEGVNQPLFTQEAEVVQLEPAHLYSLHLDAPSRGIASQAINADNHLALAPQEIGEQRLPQIAPELLGSRHYILPQDHRQLTGLPLAATQFAFVLADAQEVAGWSEAEQAALAQYLLGGGHLCLYNATGRWQGLNLGAGAQPAGRGCLLPVAGGAAEAEAAVLGWLEGELTELVLWLGGSANGEELDLPGQLPKLGRLEAIVQAFGPAQEDGEILARRPGFLHLVALYRETSRQDALEPWDYPEFLSVSTDTLLNNSNLRTLARERPDHGFPPLSQFAAAARPALVGIWLIAMLAGLPALLAGFSRRHAWVWLIVGLAGAGAALWLWDSEPPVQEQPVNLTVYDLAQNLPGMAVARELHAVQTGSQGRAGFETAPGVLIRHVAWQPPGTWDWRREDDGARWQGAGGGAYAALSTVAPATEPGLPVALNLSRPAPGRLRIELSTSALEPGEQSFLLTPLGWQVVPGGTTQARYEIIMPEIPFQPGLARLRAVRAFLKSRPEAVSNTWGNIFDRSGDLALAEAAAPGGPLMEPPPPSLVRLGLAGLVQLPTGLRGVNWNEVVLIAPLPSEDGARALAYVRYSAPLGVQ